MARMKGPIGGPEDPRHGTFNGYSNLLCRCDSCKAAAKEVNAIAKVERFTRPKTGKEHWHGTYNGYHNYNCRCGPCTAGNTIRSRELRIRSLIRKGLPTPEEKRLDKEFAISKLKAHGTPKSVEIGCRCSKCMTYITKKFNLRRLSEGRAIHGKASTYSYGCRCIDCKLANKIYRHEQYARGGNRYPRKKVSK